MKTYHYIVKGRVQGVGYRYFTNLMAEKYSILGTVENLDNGDVEIFAQGSEENIQLFKYKLLKGPVFSKVNQIIEEISDEEKFEKFKVLN